MRRYLTVLMALSFLMILGTRPEQAISEPKPNDLNAKAGAPAFAPGRLIVKVEEEAPTDALASLNRRNDARIKDKIPSSTFKIVDLPQDLSVVDAVELYEASPNVDYAEPDYALHPTETPNDTDFSKMYDLKNTGQLGGTVDSDIDASQAWNATKGNPNTVVAVIDNGVDIEHPDLTDNIWTNPDEIPGNNKDDDHNGYKDDTHGWDFYHDDSSVFDPGSDSFHGTHVAGTIAAEGNNGTGVTGVNWQAKVMPLKFIGPDRGYVSDAVEALQYAVAEGVEISNNSYGFYDNCGGCYAQALGDAIREANVAGHVFVTAAGNGGADGVGDNNDRTPFYPANYEDSNIISVAASNQHDNLTSFSNYGDTSVDLVAPGIDIYSTAPNGGYGYGYGTSMAAPHVAGVAALIKSRFPGLDDTEIKAKILQSVDRRANLRGQVVSSGRLNAARAIGLDVPPPPSSAPRVSDARPAKTGDRTPTISVSVRDAETNLKDGNVRAVYLDNKRIFNFSYSTTTDKLTFPAGRKLSYAPHRIEVTVQDPQGLSTTMIDRIRVLR